MNGTDTPTQGEQAWSGPGSAYPQSYWQRRCEAAEVLIAWLPVYHCGDERYAKWQEWQAIRAERDD